ncbi:hypothetical protein ACTOWA_00285 [Herbaspirillum seropedicae]|uniref:hypothetical protein n=1 Tax=Herbaspirillum seropedicae TaxID=964 RepID=UPI002859EDBF|nr:hypothetical protein [Herbaspirillum seropedicae]MDR6397973.1 hypothetical protein [Herbaspirillum seropedicae]
MADKAVVRICGTCRCWNLVPGKDAGECRQGPPPTRSGWYSTRAADWCVSGWRRDDRAPAPTVHRRFEIDSTGRIGINFAYVRKFPEDAMKWLSAVRDSADAVPKAFRAVVESPLSGLLTEELLEGSDDGSPSCDSILNWAAGLPGGDREDIGDEPGILRYVDTDDERAEMAAELALIPEDHPWR